MKYFHEKYVLEYFNDVKNVYSSLKESTYGSEYTIISKDL